MRFLRSFVQFWIDFIIGDAWEVAAGLAVTLVVVAIVADQVGGDLALSFVLLASLLAVTWVALLRATRGSRRSSDR